MDNEFPDPLTYYMKLAGRPGDDEVRERYALPLRPHRRRLLAALEARIAQLEVAPPLSDLIWLP